MVGYLIKPLSTSISRHDIQSGRKSAKHFCLKMFSRLNTRVKTFRIWTSRELSNHMVHSLRMSPEGINGNSTILTRGMYLIRKRNIRNIEKKLNM